MRPVSQRLAGFPSSQTLTVAPVTRGTQDSSCWDSGQGVTNRTLRARRANVSSALCFFGWGVAQILGHVVTIHELPALCGENTQFRYHLPPNAEVTSISTKNKWMIDVLSNSNPKAKIRERGGKKRWEGSLELRFLSGSRTCALTCEALRVREPKALRRPRSSSRTATGRRSSSRGTRLRPSPAPPAPGPTTLFPPRSGLATRSQPGLPAGAPRGPRGASRRPRLRSGVRTRPDRSP